MKNSDTPILWSGFSKSCIHCFRKQKMGLPTQRRVWECFVKINMTYPMAQIFHAWGLNQKGKWEYAHVTIYTQMPIVCVLRLSHQCDQRAEQSSLRESHSVCSVSTSWQRRHREKNISNHGLQEAAGAYRFNIQIFAEREEDNSRKATLQKTLSSNCCFLPNSPPPPFQHLLLYHNVINPATQYL